jgi:Bacterial virulence protein (VirJ)
VGRRRMTFALLALLGICVRIAGAQNTATLDIKGKPQNVRLYGSPGGQPLIVASGDGGWFHLGPHVAATVAASGYCVVGLDVEASSLVASELARLGVANVHPMIGGLRAWRAVGGPIERV